MHLVVSWLICLGQLVYILHVSYYMTFCRVMIPHWYFAYVRVIYTLVPNGYMLGLCIPYWHDSYTLG